MKLYSGPLSLYARKVEIALREKLVPFEREFVPFNQSQGYSPKHPAVLAANPKRQVPVLICGTLELYDSTVILEFLEDAYPSPPLYPADPGERAQCRLLDLFADEVMIVPLRALMHRTEPREPTVTRWDEAEAGAANAVEAIAEHHRALDRRLTGQRYLLGEFGAADISVFMAVLFSQRLGGPLLDPCPALAAWYGRMKARPAFAETIAEIAAADRDLSAPVPGGRM